MKSFVHHHLHRADVHLDAAKQRVRIEVKGYPDERLVIEVDRATLTVNRGDTPGETHSADWVAGVRWAADEADAQTAYQNRGPNIIDVTDHLRICADDPGRGTAVPRGAAPADHTDH